MSDSETARIRPTEPAERLSPAPAPPHSPAPFRIHTGLHLRVVDANGGVVCGVHRKGRFMGRKPSEVAAEALANAHLFAAAPDMLAALKEAAQFIKDRDAGDPKHETGWASDEYLDAWLNATAAIAKAEGRP